MTKPHRVVKLVGPCVGRDLVEAWVGWGARWRWQLIGYTILSIGGGIMLGLIGAILVLRWLGIL